jgi:hypothetical protein
MLQKFFRLFCVELFCNRRGAEQLRSYIHMEKIFSQALAIFQVFSLAFGTDGQLQPFTTGWKYWSAIAD